MGRLNGKTAIITGAAQGMGEATARLFAAEGARVALADVKDDVGERVAAEIGDAAFYRHLDVSKNDEWCGFVAAVVEKWGAVDVLVNNAGLVHFTAIEDFEAEDAERLLGVNTIGPMLGVKHVAPIMKEQKNGSIINISSVDGLRGCNGLTLYTASKWAVRGLTKSLAYELGAHGIRVNSIHPGGVNTPMGNSRGMPVEQVNQTFRRVPLQRIGEPEEIARASLFIASDEASYISGAELAVDGGWAAGYYMPVLPGAPEGLSL